jgi:3-hydroxybutyryl-CoA dehydrogenase
MNVEDIQRIAVIGVGFIGHQIAQEFAMAGYTVHLHDTNEKKLQTALSNIHQNLHTLATADFLNPDQIQPVMNRFITHSQQKSAVDDVDVVVEAVYEDLHLKQQVFQQLDMQASEHAILASTSGALMPSEIASTTSRPERILVTHYINPPYLLPVVELVRSPQTSDATVDTMFQLYQHIGKSPVIVQKEVPGFIVNRLQFALWREAWHIVEQGIASPQDVDTVVADSFGRRLNLIGVFNACDMGGWDLISTAAAYMFPHLSHTTEVPQLIKDKVTKGELGVKSGKGFYEWNTRSPTDTPLFQAMMHRLVQIAKWPKPEY